MAAMTFVSIVLLISIIPVVQVNASGLDENGSDSQSGTNLNAESSSASIVALRAPPEEEKTLVVRATLVGETWGVDTNALRTLFVNGIKSYYLEVSYDQVNMNTTYISANYTMLHNESYYATDPSTILELIEEALIKAEGDVNSSGGYQIFKHIVIVHSGTDAAATHNFEDITSEFVYSSGGLFSIGGVKIMNACIVAEGDPLGVVVHELGHSQGLPDLYSYAAVGLGDTFLGEWDLMAAGSWNPSPQGTSPSHMTTWCKNKLGWMKPTETVNISQSSIASGNNVTVLLNPQEVQNPTLSIKIQLTNGTYFMVEDRLRIGYDSALPNNGVLVLFCDDSIASGYGPVRLMSAHPPSLGADAAYNVGYFTVSFYGDKLANIGVKVINKWSNGTFKIFIGDYNSALNAPVEYQDTTIPMVAMIGGITILVVVAILVYFKKGRQKAASSAYETVPVIKLS
jgi:M6 family metalloprotease-like protein